MAIERGPWRDTASDFLISYAQDEWRYRLQHELFLRPAQTTVTFRNNASQTALPVRNWGAFMLGNGVGAGPRCLLLSGDKGVCRGKIRVDRHCAALARIERRLAP